jgi:hypothetical protein
MENKERAQTNTKSSLGLLIVEGGFEDQVCSLSLQTGYQTMVVLICDFFLGRRIGVISRTSAEIKG